jgi:hypothetical protein
MPLKRAVAAAIAAVAALAAAPASADWDPRQDGSRCFEVAFPESSSGGVDDRSSSAYVAVTHDRAENSWDAVSFVSGFKDPGVIKVIASVDGEDFELLPYGGAAFAKGGKTEESLVQAMMHGTKLTVTWVMITPNVTDTYSLEGFSGAHKRIDDYCNR